MSEAPGRVSEKRGPSTPLALSKTQNKRILLPKLELDVSVLMIQPATTSDYQSELLEAKYQKWLVDSELAKQKLLTQFLELEREFSVS